MAVPATARHRGGEGGVRGVGASPRSQGHGLRGGGVTTAGGVAAAPPQKRARPAGGRGVGCWRPTTHSRLALSREASPRLRHCPKGGEGAHQGPRAGPLVGLAGGTHAGGRRGPQDPALGQAEPANLRCAPPSSGARARVGVWESVWGEWAAGDRCVTVRRSGDSSRQWGQRLGARGLRGPTHAGGLSLRGGTDRQRQKKKKKRRGGPGPNTGPPGGAPVAGPSEQTGGDLAPRRPAFKWRDTRGLRRG